MNDKVAYAGVMFAIIGGVAIIGAGIVKGSMDRDAIYDHPGMYDTFDTIADVGIVVFLIGIISLVIGYAIPNFDQTRPQMQDLYARVGVPNQTTPTDQRTFCPHCGKPYQGTPFCAYCGKEV